jgi:hypothetical protein
MRIRDEWAGTIVALAMLAVGWTIVALVKFFF